MSPGTSRGWRVVSVLVPQAWVEATSAKSVTLAQLMGLAVGQRLTWERTFTEDDVRQFAEVSGDRGAHHVQPGPDGRVMVQGLLTATLPTKIGGDLSFMAREMTFEFVRPVFSGDAITTDVSILSVEPEGSREWASIEAVCRNQAGKDVLLAHIRGFVTVPDAARAHLEGRDERSE